MFEEIGKDLDQQHGLQKRLSSSETEARKRIGGQRCDGRPQNRHDDRDEERIDVPAPGMDAIVLLKSVR